MFRGFKDFLLRGNVIDLSVAVVIGAAFTAVVTAFTESFLKPLIQLLSPGGEQFRGTVRVSGVVFDYAGFINQAITFLITAAVVYLLIVAPMQAIQNRRLRGAEDGPVQATDVELLTQIRDLLETQVEQRPDDGSSSRPPMPPVPPAATGWRVDETAPVPPATRPAPPPRPVAADSAPRHSRAGVR